MGDPASKKKGIQGASWFVSDLLHRQTHMHKYASTSSHVTCICIQKEREREREIQDTEKGQCPKH